MHPQSRQKLVRAKYTKGEATLEKIREACIQEIVHRGYHHTSVCEIVRRAQLTRGAFYNYWVSLDHCISDLLLVIREIMAEDPELARYHASLPDASFLVNTVRTVMHSVVERGSLYPLLPLALIAEKDLNNEELVTILNDYCAEVQGEYVAAIEADRESGYLRADLSSRPVAATVMLYLRGLLELNVVRPPALLADLGSGFRDYLAAHFTEEYLNEFPIADLPSEFKAEAPLRPAMAMMRGA